MREVKKEKNIRIRKSLIGNVRSISMGRKGSEVDREVTR